MDDLTAIGIIECPALDQTDEDVFSAFQHLIDNGTIRHLQGFYQRTAMNLIESGHCTNC